MPTFFVRPYSHSNWRETGVDPTDSIRIVDAPSLADAKAQASKLFGVSERMIYPEYHPQIYNEHGSEGRIEVAPDGMIRWLDGTTFLDQIADLLEDR